MPAAAPSGTLSLGSWPGLHTPYSYLHLPGLYLCLTAEDGMWCGDDKDVSQEELSVSLSPGREERTLGLTAEAFALPYLDSV